MLAPDANVLGNRIQMVVSGQSWWTNQTFVDKARESWLMSVSQVSSNIEQMTKRHSLEYLITFRMRVEGCSRYWKC